MTEHRYALTSSVHACVADDQVVFLDLRQDRYLCLDKETSLSLRPILSSLLLADAATAYPSTQAQQAVLSELARVNLVTSDITGRCSRAPLILPRAAEALPEEMRDRPALGLGHVTNFYLATLRAGLALRILPIQSVVENERRRALTRVGTQESFEPARAAELMSIFRSLHVFSSIRRQCLFYSLAIKLFMSQYAMFPQWVFGVRMNPFGAHCWLQHQRCVINDEVEYVNAFTPIMVI